MNRQQPPPSHNLQIQSYSFEELLGLFDLKSYDLTPEDMKRAKNRVLMLHPDKSRLPADYFLFYKKAFEVVVQFYENQTRQAQKVPDTEVVYAPTNQGEDRIKNQVQGVMKQMEGKGFQDKFNHFFEQNKMASRPEPKRNEWFQTEKPTNDVPQNVNAKDMGQVFDKMKQQSTGLTRYQGVQNMSYQSGGNYYDDDAANDDSYVTSDPFSKLKFDDLRKVHKDQTVFAVSESDFSKVQQYQSVDHYNRERSRQSLDPMDKTQAQKILEEQERLAKEANMRREYQAKLASKQYEEKNKNVLSAFLQLGN
jgi:hypothetical protein